MATEAVCKYLRDTNRPYSANDIVMNLHKKFGKAEVTRALDALVAKEQITEKVYGKQKVYAVIQEDGENSEVENDLKKLEESCSTLTARLEQSQEKAKVADVELKSLLSTLPTIDASIERDRLEIQVEKLREKLKELSENKVQISPEMRTNTEASHARAVATYRKRKRICMDIVDSVMEGYPKSKKQLCEEVGIETDDSVGCVIKG